MLILAAFLRFHDLGGLSLWYDEVVSMTLARTSGPAELLRELSRVDATAAPLHPLLLQGWLAILGPSDAAGRALSAVCGVLTVAMVHRLGTRMLGDPKAAGWAAALSAVSPLLVYYSREARMYALLTLLTCLAWDALFAMAERPRRRSSVSYVLCLVGLAYSHPLGLLMDATLAGTSLVVSRSRGRSWRAWLWPHLLTGLLVLPWLPRYLDHPPEYTLGRLPLKFLLGTPIGFVGGNFLSLGLLLSLIARGVLVSRDVRVSTTCLLAWLIVPPLTLYAYSRVGHPIFGPNRYTLFVAPAFLLLLGHGLARLPGRLSWPAGVGLLALSASTLPAMVFAPGLKADWRAVAALLKAADPTGEEPLVVASPDPNATRNLEVVTASYYEGESRRVLALPKNAEGLAKLLSTMRGPYWLAEPTRGADATVPGLRIRRIRPKGSESIKAKTTGLCPNFVGSAIADQLLTCDELVL